MQRFVRQLRLWSGLIVAAFVIPHFINHAFGLVSLEAMEAVRGVLGAVWSGPPGGPLLLLAFAVHFFTSLAPIYQRSTLRMPAWEAAQIVLGLLVFPLVLIHVIGTAIAGQVIGFEPTYEFVIASIWIAQPGRGLQQAVLLLVVWAHLCVGLHFWLRLKTWYRRSVPYVYGGALLIPVLGLLGFARVGRELSMVAGGDPGFFERVFEPINAAPPELVADLLGLEPKGWVFFGVVIASVFAARYVRRLYRNRHGVYCLNLTDGRTLSAPVGQTILETLRAAGVLHAAVCGGRGRCTTCRVHVGEATRHLPAPSELESAALARIGAAPEVRLACQTRPRRELSIIPLLPPGTTAQDANRPGGIQGREQKVAAMFIDLRDSTRLGENKLPYDVLFVLNQYFAEMAAALAETDGHYAQFSGDGLMALYGVHVEVETGCRDAIRGASAMFRRLDALNDRLGHELAEPLRMGIGIHCGDAIVGTMGPPTAQNFSAIGDNINIAARLEALTKEYRCSVVISEAVAECAKIDLSAYPRHAAGVRGRDETVLVYAVDNPLELLGLGEPAIS